MAKGVSKEEMGKEMSKLDDKIKEHKKSSDTALNTIIHRMSKLEKESETYNKEKARYLCKPPLEADKENDLQKILERTIALRGSQGLHEGESLEESVSKTLADALTDRWIFRLPEKEWYRYKDGHWSTHEGAGYDFMNDLEEELNRKEGNIPPAIRGEWVRCSFESSWRSI
ncbi:hypothetical protein L7F22_028766 [Adiantum nelumboides]|nr:hypothetical protein [Adiantum nelumboides]